MKKLYLCALLLAFVTLLSTVGLLSSCTKDEPPEETVAATESETETVPAETEPDTEPESIPETETVPETETEPEPVTETVPETEPETDYFEYTKIELVEPDASKVLDVAVTDEGYDINRLIDGIGWGYRYGCTYLYNDDGSVDAYFACVGNASDEWDWIAYRHSPDGGETWEPERIVLTPTQGSMDHFSNCDPGVVYFNGYYYLGYTSTLNSAGACNNVFVARSENPDGPFEKWNGSGWGGYEPQPILYHDERYGQWGIGEPAFVELNGTLYIYYTHMGDYGDYTMVATADATDENWPATMEYHGVACRKNTDSIDIKYVEEWGKFIGVGTGDRVTPNSWLGIYESNDGLHFELKDIVREGTFSHLNNAGISSRPNGHIRVSEDADKLRVIYAYGETWGSWNTRVQPISLSLSDGNDLSAERAKSCLPGTTLMDPMLPKEDRHVAMVRPAQDVYRVSASEKSFTIRLNQYDTYFNRTFLRRYEEGEVVYTVYDETVITINPSNGKATVVGVGTTAVDVQYAGCTYRFHVVITEEDPPSGTAQAPVAFDPVFDSYTIYIGERLAHRPQIRVRCLWDNGSFTELFVDDKATETLTYTGYDKSIIAVDSRGIVTAMKVGETTVTVTMGEWSCDIKVIVSDDPADGHYSMSA